MTIEAADIRASHVFEEGAPDLGDGASLPT
jgi:hypothetical protein